MAKRNLEKCCFCLPVRHGLLVWGYTKLVISLLVSSTFIYVSVRLFSLVPESYDYAVTFLGCVTTTIPELLDLIFTLVLIIAVHKRNLKMLEVYYYYSITMVAVFLLVILLTACSQDRFQLLHNLIFHHAFMLKLDYYTLWGFGLGHICLQSYLMMLTRSEVHQQRAAPDDKITQRKSKASFRGQRVGLVIPSSRTDV